MAASLKMAQVDSLVSAPSPACIHTAQDGAEYWDIVQHRIYPEGPYVYISAATSFLKGRVKGSWHRGKDTTSRYNRITFHSKIYWKTLYLLVCTGKEAITGVFPFTGHVTNKKWPLNEGRRIGHNHFL